MLVELVDDLSGKLMEVTGELVEEVLVELVEKVSAKLLEDTEWQQMC